MTPQLTAYILEETEKAVRIMLRDRAALHVFNVGKDGDGKNYVMMLAIIPEENFQQQLDKLGMTLADSKPC